MAPHNSAYRRASRRATRQLRQAGYTIRKPPFPQPLNQTILWIFEKNSHDNQVGCISPCTDNPNVAVVVFHV